jgi:hypothetical protein
VIFLGFFFPDFSSKKSYFEFFTTTNMGWCLISPKLNVQYDICITNILWKFQAKKHNWSWDRAIWLAWRIITRSFTSKRTSQHGISKWQYVKSIKLSYLTSSCVFLHGIFTECSWCMYRTAH